MTFDDLDQLDAHNELFVDPQLSDSEKTGSYIQVIDNFYSDPQKWRAKVLKQQILSLRYSFR